MLPETLTLFDYTFLGITALLIISACLRGLSKELLHTLIFIAAMVAGVIFLGQTHPTPPESTNSADTQAVFLALNLAYFAIAAYLLTAVLIRLLSPVLMKTPELGMRDRLSAGLLALTKITLTAVLIHVWYIAHTPLPHPERTAQLPTVLQTSTLFNLSDSPTGWASQTAGFLTTYGVITPISASPPPPRHPHPLAKPIKEGYFLQPCKERHPSCSLLLNFNHFQLPTCKQSSAMKQHGEI